MNKLNLGCGKDIQTSGGNWVNLDRLNLPGVDVVHDLGKLPYPFEDGMFSYIKAQDVMEHLPNFTEDGRPMYVAFIEECHRLLEPNGTLWIQTPGWDASFMWIDPTHVRGFDVQSMDFFDPDTDFGRSTGFYSQVKFKVKAIKMPNKNIQFTMVKR